MTAAARYSGRIAAEMPSMGRPSIPNRRTGSEYRAESEARRKAEGEEKRSVILSREAAQRARELQERDGLTFKALVELLILRAP